MSLESEQLAKIKHKLKPGLVTVPGNSGKELATGTLGSIFKQAGLKK